MRKYSCFSYGVECGHAKGYGLFDFCFLKLFLRTVFENIEDNILTFFINYFCYLNLEFYVFLYVFLNKKKWKPTSFVKKTMFGSLFFLFRKT